MSESDDGPAGFGIQLRRHRMARALTQDELARRSGISVRAIRDMERGRARGPQRRTVDLLAHALELDGQARERLQCVARSGRARSAAAMPSAAEDARGARASSAASWQLPPNIEWFRGRGAELAALHREIGPGRAARRSATVVCVSGQPGVGKTALAIRAAHDLAPRFPDGQFFVSLRGMEPRPADPADVCATLLRSLGADDRQIPPSLDERVGLFRSLVYERRVLIVLDNAHDEAQVRPLLPSGPGCAALITSRRTMVGLSGVVRVALGAVDPVGAREILAGIVGEDRLRDEVAAVDELADLCGYLPLALRVAGSRMATRPHWSFARLAAQLQDERNRLQTLSIGDVSVLTAFEVSYRQLSVRAQRLLRRISLLSGQSFGMDTAAVLLGDEPPAALAALDELVDGSLVDAHSSGRYGTHDLTRVFAGAQLAEHDGEQVARLQARVDDWFLDLASAAGRSLFPEHESQRPDALTRDQAIALLDIEADNYLPALQRAAAAGRHRIVCQFVAAMHWYSDVVSSRPWTGVFRLGLASARAIGDKAAELTCLSFYGWALYYCDREFDRAASILDEAARLAEELGDHTQRAWSLSYLGTTEAQRGDTGRAVGLLDEAAAVFHGLGDTVGERISRNRLGQVLYKAGQFAAAATVFRSVLGDADSLDMIGAYSLSGLGKILAATGDWEAGADACRRAGDALMAWGYPGLAGTARAEEGRSLHRLGRSREAQEALEDALRIAVETSDRAAQAEVLGELATVAEGLGDTAAATRYRREAAEIAAQLASSATDG